MEKINPIRQKVYKVVSCYSNGLLQSSQPEVRASGYSLIYKPNKITRPKIGKIFTFLNLQSARDWVNNDNYLQIWEAEGYGAEKGKFRLSINYLSPRNLKTLWITNNVDFAFMSPVPTDTVFCKSIKLIKKIQ